MLVLAFEAVDRTHFTFKGHGHGSPLSLRAGHFEFWAPWPRPDQKIGVWVLLVRFSPYLFYPIRILYIELFHTRFRHLRLLVMLNIRNSELLTVPCTRLSQRSRQRCFFSHIPVSLSVRFPMTVFSATFWTIDFIVAFFVGYYVSGSLEPWYTLVKVVAQWDKYTVFIDN